MKTTSKKGFFNLTPESSVGKHSVELILVFVIMFCIFQLLVISGQRGGETFFDNLLLSTPALIMAGCGVAAFITGVSVIVSKKERSLVVFLSTLLGFFVLMFLMGEIFFPH